ncbi:hypothetical protein BJ170DRAFT_593049 [Xylariales sp. AK1849]|nr:hypothetical protein BJ170DRAFT_593049 [Xylariales sp. AK1849]
MAQTPTLLVCHLLACLVIAIVSRIPSDEGTVVLDNLILQDKRGVAYLSMERYRLALKVYQLLPTHERFSITRHEAIFQSQYSTLTWGDLHRFRCLVPDYYLVAATHDSGLESLIADATVHCRETRLDHVKHFLRRGQRLVGPSKKGTACGVTAVEQCKIGYVQSTATARARARTF